VDLEDEADDLLDMELEDESQKTESTLEDIKKFVMIPQCPKAHFMTKEF
jgi:hypothetical protein